MIIQQILFSRHLDEEEKLLYVGHKHWITCFRSLFKISFFAFLIPWLIYVFMGTLPFLFFALFASAIGTIRMLYIFIDWFFDAILITSVSLLFVEWNGFFSQESTRISYESIESIAIETKGVLGAIFGFGIIEIERDGAEAIKMKHITNPKRVELEILHAKEEVAEHEMSENKEALHEILVGIVADHIKKHGWKK